MSRCVRVVWSAQDGEYVGLCDDFPSLSWLAPVEIDALAGIIRLVEESDLVIRRPCDSETIR